jgi:(2Fe-2S) ferredoxin
MSNPTPSLFEKAGIPSAQHHLFLCIGPECCNPEEGNILWDHAKAAIKRLAAPVMRTKALCFRVCSGGPWLLIYPEGIWYGSITPDRFDRILKEHVLDGKPVQEWVSLTHPLQTVCHLTTPTETKDESPS